MTKFVKLNVLTALGVALVVSSCGTSNNVVSGGIFTKRKHTKGYHVNLPSKFKGAKSNAELLEKEAVAVQDVEGKTMYVVEKATKNQVVEAVADVPANTTVNSVKEESEVTKTVSKRIAAVEKMANSNSSVKKTTVAEKVFKNKINKMEKKNSSSYPVETVILVILAIFIPPLAVYLYEGSATKTFWINLILTLLCGLPGMIHALIVVLR